MIKSLSRRGTNCYKWDKDPYDDILPLWVADMDFEVAPAISQAVARRAQHGVFGYTQVPASFRESIVRWHSEMYGWDALRPEWILYTSGVVPAVSAIIKALTMPGEGVVVLTPVYNCFFSSIRNNECKAIQVPLRRTALSYEVDFEAFEQAVARPEARLFLLCNPHNPAGRVWSPDELRRMGDICRRHDVIVVSDEIHSGIIMPGHRFTPFASLGPDYEQMSVTTSSSSKSFNTAGLQIAYIFTSIRSWRDRIDRALNINEVCDVNPFGIVALETAYNECRPWLAELNNYVWDNYCLLRDFVQKHMPSVSLLSLEGTYLAWLDVRALGQSSESLCNRLLTEAHVRLSPGTIYGPAGEGYLRLNLACSRDTLSEALSRIAPLLQLPSQDN